MKTIYVLVVGFALTFATTSCKKDVLESIPSSNMADAAETDNEPVPLKGNIKNQQGSAIASAGVQLFKIMGGIPNYIGSTNSDSHGAFVFSTVYFGDYRLIITATGYTTDTVPCSMPLVATELDLGDIVLTTP